MTIAPLARESIAYTAETLSFDALYRDCSRQIYNFVVRSVRAPQDAEDVCQEVWAHVYRCLPTIREPGAARGWLYRIARNAIIDLERRRRRAPKQGRLVIEPAADASHEPSQTLIANEQAAFAWQALGALQPRQRMALYLKEVEGRRYREIAETLDCSESAVETLLFRARKRFADRYGCLEESRANRCGQARRTMAVVLDGEGTSIDRRALDAHLDECEECRASLAAARQTVAARAALPLLPLGVGAPLLGQGGPLAIALESARGLVAQFAVALTGKASLAAATMAVTTAIAATAISPGLDLGHSAQVVPGELAPPAVDLLDALVLETDEPPSTPGAVATTSDAPSVRLDTTSGVSTVLRPLDDVTIAGADVAHALDATSAASIIAALPLSEPATELLVEATSEAATVPLVVIPTPEPASITRGPLAADPELPKVPGPLRAQPTAAATLTIIGFP